MVKHRALILTTDPAEIAQKAATVRYHTRESDLLLQERKFKNKAVNGCASSYYLALRSGGYRYTEEI